MKKFLVLSLLVALMISCKKNEPRTSFQGGWNVTEINEMTGVQRTYQVNIVRDPVNLSHYNIYNFHNIGDNQNTYVQFTEDDEGVLIIEGQTIGNSNAWVQGFGTVEPEYAGITWKYEFNDGAEQYVVADYY